MAELTVPDAALQRAAPIELFDSESILEVMQLAVWSSVTAGRWPAALLAAIDGAAVQMPWPMSTECGGRGCDVARI